MPSCTTFIVLLTSQATALLNLPTLQQLDCYPIQERLSLLSCSHLPCHACIFIHSPKRHIRSGESWFFIFLHHIKKKN
ncbi:hypothetical protein V6Z12_A05G132300 [Gossypium hirsutum]